MSQSARLLEFLSDGRWHRTDDILREVYGDDHLGIARIGARIHGLKQDGAAIEGRRDEKIKSLYWYRLLKPPVNAENRASRPAMPPIIAASAPGDLFPWD